MTIVDLAAEAPATARFGHPGHDPVDDLWARLWRPFDAAGVLWAITGLSARVAAAQIATAVAGSPEADRLLDELPRTIRSLATSTALHTERCRGELRGPVLWSETISARASSFGDEDLHICLTPSRAYDVGENRVLVAALVAVRDAAQVAMEHTPAHDHDSALFARIRRNGTDARRFVEHPSLAGVARVVPTGRMLARTRASKKRRSYSPALDLLSRAANPLDAPTVRAWCDRRTRAQLWMLTAVLAGIEAAGVHVPAVRAVDGHLEVGDLRFHRPALLGDPRSPSGITFGSLLVDVPDELADPDRSRAEAALLARAGGRHVVLVRGEDDIDQAVAQVLARRGGTRTASRN
jgi:hypothetical protein